MGYINCVSSESSVWVIWSVYHLRVVYGLYGSYIILEQFVDYMDCISS